MSAFPDPPNIEGMEPAEAIKRIVEWGADLADQITESFKAVSDLENRSLFPEKDLSLTVAQLAGNGYRPTVGRRAFCTDAPGGAQPVYADGSVWRKVRDGTAVT